MKFMFENSDVIFSENNEQIHQYSVNANKIEISFKDIDIGSYTPYITFLRADGKTSPLIGMAFGEVVINSIGKRGAIYNFSDEWVTGVAGELKFNIVLKKDKTIINTGVITLYVNENIDNDKITYIDDVAYNALVDRIGTIEKNYVSIEAFERRTEETVEFITKKIPYGDRTYIKLSHLTSNNTIENLYDALTDYNYIGENNVEYKFYIELGDGTILENIHINSYSEYYDITSIIRNGYDFKIYIGRMWYNYPTPTITEFIAQHSQIVNYKDIENLVNYEALGDALDSIEEQIPTKVSQLENDSNYVTESDLQLVGTGVATLITQLDEQKANKVDIPTKVSQLENDSNYTTQDYVNNLLSNFSSLDLEPVDVLPTENISTSTIYLLKTDTTDETNIYEEYIYVNDKWEMIGTTEVDLGNYVNQESLSRVETNLLALISQLDEGKANKTELPTRMSQLTNDGEAAKNENPTVLNQGTWLLNKKDTVTAGFGTANLKFSDNLGNKFEQISITSNIDSGYFTVAGVLVGDTTNRSYDIYHVIDMGTGEPTYLGFATTVNNYYLTFEDEDGISINSGKSLLEYIKNENLFTNYSVSKYATETFVLNKIGDVSSEAVIIDITGTIDSSGNIETSLDDAMPTLAENKDNLENVIFRLTITNGNETKYSMCDNIPTYLYLKGYKYNGADYTLLWENDRYSLEVYTIDYTSVNYYAHRNVSEYYYPKSETYSRTSIDNKIERATKNLIDKAVVDFATLPNDGTTVPNSGTVDKVYFNTALGRGTSSDLVYEVLDKYYNEDDEQYQTKVDLLVVETNNAYIHIQIYDNYYDEPDTTYHGIVVRELNSNTILWTDSAKISKREWGTTDCWNPNVSFINVFNLEVMNTYNGNDVGTYNDLLKNFFSITPYITDKEKNIIGRLDGKLYHYLDGEWKEIGSSGKEYVDEKIGDIEAILDQLNGEVV